MPTKSPKKKMTLADLVTMMSPHMVALVEEMVIGYMALRSGVTVDQARATVDTQADVRASFERKMMRTLALLAGPGGFKFGKHENQPNAAPVAPAAPDVSAMLAAIAKGNQPGAK